MDDHGHDDRHDTVSGDANETSHAETSDSVAQGATTGRMSLFEVLDEPGEATELGGDPATPVRFTYTPYPRDEHVDVNCDRPFDPVMVRRVALRVAALCDDPASVWWGLLSARGKTVEGADPVGFAVTYDPPTRTITVNPDARCTLRLLRWGALDVAKACDAVASSAVPPRTS